MTVTLASTTEHLLAAWREAQRMLDELQPDEQGRAEAEARVEEARSAYQARIDAIEALPAPHGQPA